MLSEFTGYTKLPDEARHSVMVIGNFDGVHRGHQALIRHAKQIAKDKNAPLSIMTFSPHPRVFFNPEIISYRLTHLPMKKRLLADLGVDHLHIIPFDAAFSQVTAEEFLKLLAETYQVSHVVVGDDFFFGKGRKGCTEMLKSYAEETDAFTVTVSDEIKSEEGMSYSSTAVRDALQSGDLTLANDLLGWGWQMESEVVHGDKRGRELGYPTANCLLDEYVRIPFGVYAVKVAIGDDRLDPAWINGVANIGIRPMFETATPLLETFIFDFDREIYGKMIRVKPVKFLRPEAKFGSLEDLITQIEQDCQEAKNYL